MSKINRSIGTRAEGVRALRTYEIPKEVVTEAIVNAVAHRDYTDNGSVQIMLFADRLEVWNLGRLSPPLTLEKLRVPHRSVPGNPLLAESLYLAEYIERMGTGTLDMIRRCVEVGLPEPEFTITDGFVTTVRRKALAGQVAGQVADEVMTMIAVFRGDHTRRELQLALNPKSRANFEGRYLKPAIEAGCIMLTLPNKPRSRLQKYRLTAKGRAAVASLKPGNAEP